MMFWFYKIIVFPIYYIELTLPAMLLLSSYYPASAVFLRRVALLWAIFVLSPLPQYLLIQLENAYPKVFTENLSDDIEGIIIPGGYHDLYASNSRGFPVYGERAARFFEAVELLKQRPNLKVLVTGKGDTDTLYGGEAQLSLNPLKNFGIPEANIILETQSQTTRQNAQMTAELLGDKKSKKWLLVTSAFHMKRSVMLFKKYGINVLPYPVGYRTAKTINYGKLFRLDYALKTYRTVMREFLGQWGARLF